MSTAANKKKQLLIIGVGNRYRQDDGVGPALVQRLKKKLGPSADLVEKSGEGAELMETWKNYNAVYLIDAVSSKKKPGTIHRFDAAKEKLPQDFFHYSTHAFSVAEAVELARALNELPPRLIIYGIEGKNFNSGQGLSKEAKKALTQVEQSLLQEINFF